MLEAFFISQTAVFDISCLFSSSSVCGRSASLTAGGNDVSIIADVVSFFVELFLLLLLLLLLPPKFLSEITCFASGFLILVDEFIKVVVEWFAVRPCVLV